MLKKLLKKKYKKRITDTADKNKWKTFVYGKTKRSNPEANQRLLQ